MAQDIYSTLLNGVQAINRLTTTIGSIFPQVTVSSSAAPGSLGNITFTSSEASGFLLVTTSSGATVKVPFYPE